MKKLFFINFALFFTSLCFAIPNIMLYQNAQFVCQIKDGKIYYDDEFFFDIRGNELYQADEYIGTITEDENRLLLDFYSDGNLKNHFEYSKETGFLLIKKSYWFEEDVSEYDEKTGLIKKILYYSNGQLISYEIYDYEKGNLSKTSYYKADGSSDGYTLFVYDKKTENKIKESRFDESNNLSCVIEYDSMTKERIQKQDYNNDGSVKNKTLYDKKSGEAVERFIYDAYSKKPEKWTFIKFDKDGNYELDSTFYLSKYFCFYYGLEHYSEESKTEPIEWNENYSAFVRKYNFDKNTDGYEVIKTLKSNRMLSSMSFTLCNGNSNFYYCFNTDENDEIDISSCYEIELVKKPKNYPAMNKSGKGKGPFGFDIGMTYEEVKEACGDSELEHIADNRYYAKPKKAHPLFETYIVWISDSVGLYYIKGVSRDISTSDYGTEAKQRFNNLLATLEKKYGKFNLIDTIKSDYYWKDEKYWTEALRDGARTYQANWSVTTENYNGFDGLFGIGLGIEISNKYSTSESYIWIEYQFQNYSDAQEALNDVL